MNKLYSNAVKKLIELNKRLYDIGMEMMNAHCLSPGRRDSNMIERIRILEKIIYLKQFFNLSTAKDIQELYWQAKFLARSELNE